MTAAEPRKVMPEFPTGRARVLQTVSRPISRQPASGYKVIFVPFANGRPAGAPLDVLTGFLDAEGNARGRPVGVASDGKGGRLVADDVGNIVWRVAAAPPS